MKKLMAFFIASFMVSTMIAPAFADSGAGLAGEEQTKNVRVGSRNVSTGWVEVLDATHTEAAKGKDIGEQMTGLVAVGAIGVRKTIHRVGGGVIDLLTFWIPKKQPLVNPEQPRLQ